MCGINNLKIMSHFYLYIMKGKLREDPAKYVSCYWIASLTTYLKLSKNCMPFSNICPDQKINHTVVRFLVMFIGNGTLTKSINTSLSEDPVISTLDLLKKLYTK
jgi:hypothetical protein